LSAEIKALVNCLGLRERTLVLLAASTGLRQSEIFGLKWGGTVRKVGAINAGRQVEGVAFSPNGKYLYVANFHVGDFTPGTLQIYRVQGDTVVDTGKVLMLPGHPASMRGSAP
jgi:hypothetical protein